jgi:phosphoribosylanthranilate isomerase
MTKIKLCGLKRPCDIQVANECQPEYIGFIFAPKSKRYVTPEAAEDLKKLLSPNILAVGVFVNELVEKVADLLNRNIIDIAQLHGAEDEKYIESLRSMTDKKITKAFRIDRIEDVKRANQSTADYILLDSKEGGSGTVFDWELLEAVERPYFLAGGLGVENVGEAVRRLHPYAVDVSSGIETDGVKDEAKMKAFVECVRKEK